MSKLPSTAWQKSGAWYDSHVGYLGSHYHQEVIIPKTLTLLNLQKKSELLDLACGQGVLARHIPQEVSYVGIDAAKILIQKARHYHLHEKNRTFYHADITKTPLPLPRERRFSHATCILAMQNIEHPLNVMKNAASCLAPQATFVIVLNHPCFRIPRQTSWGFDEASRFQFRKVNIYMSPQKIPISTHPSQKESDTSISFHYPLSTYFSFLHEAGFVVELLQEWCSDKISTGKAASWENRARQEFPLFLAIQCSYSGVHTECKTQRGQNIQ